ncbi:hypothetical protein DVK00_02825 [Haloarcula sp. Atlit-47R]|uniref:hypothetical protein n=1 Tax=Haloarcula sp. Atlit-47R TaxID=2282132 RepID=UPI000EF22AA1|nr:hypothetical protein [Haloarcula sp. Atlit-47R]RLM47458.1 hypothetical protein DVK00_02825 [Haloarcula sp. Atlit-47R]
MSLQITDNDDEAIRLLRAIAQGVATDAQTPDEVVVNRTQNISTSRPSDENTADYFSNGPNPIRVESKEEFTRLPLGLLAAQVSIRTDDDLVVAFATPEDEGNHLLVRTQDSPFGMGSGETPLNTAFVWLKKAPTASDTSDATVYLVAQE